MIAEKNHSLSVVTRYNAPGVYTFAHKYDFTLIYCGRSHNINGDLTTMMERLFLEDDLDLSPLEVHLKKHPSAADCSVTMFVHQQHNVNLEWAKRIIEFESLYPKGLNEEL